MTGRRRSTPLSRLLLAVVLALALFGRLPVGWMPEARGGEVRVLLCSEHGPMTVALDLGGEVPDDLDEAGQCPFALAAGPLLDLAAAPVPPFAVAVSREVHSAYREAPPAATLGHHHPPARGPPMLA